ncbi:lipase family protein [Burkholderia sp. JPY481]
MNARDFALLASEAYTAAPDIGKADSASRAIVRQTEAGLVVAFPGTDNVACWLTDLDAVPTAVDGAGDVHRGFWQAWQAIAGDVTAAISGEPVTFVGHSLGAAIAICAAVSLMLNGQQPLAVYAFEPPRVSPGVGVRTLLEGVPLHLYRNGNDVVPDVPLGWQHAALLTRIGTPLLPFPNARDHAIERVIAALS